MVRMVVEQDDDEEEELMGKVGMVLLIEFLGNVEEIVALFIGDKIYANIAQAFISYCFPSRSSRKISIVPYSTKPKTRLNLRY